MARGDDKPKNPEDASLEQPVGLDVSPPLKEIADPPSLRKLCEHLRDLVGVPLAIYDLEGIALVPPAPIPAHCDRLCKGHGQAERCAATKTNVALPIAFDERTEARGCFTGLRYLAISLRSGMDPVGVAVLGPFLDPEARAGDLPEGIAAEERAALAKDLELVPKLTAAEAARIGSFASSTLELFLFASLKSYLTAQVHLESVNDSFRELQAKNRELRASFDKLKALDLLKSNFLATVSHELRTPLTSIIGYGEMVLEGIGGKVPPGARKHVDLIVQKGEQLLELINSILDMSKIESGRMELSVERIVLPKVVEDALASVQPQAAKKKIKITTKVERVPELVADRYKLRQILVNLLSNAVKFTPESGKVKISATREGAGPETRVIISVADSGIGIPPEQLSKVFERFYQVDNSSTRQYGGTGLGLPIVRSFVEMHGGKVRVESEPGKGTTFVVELPVAPPPRSSNPPPAAF